MLDAASTLAQGPDAGLINVRLASARLRGALDRLPYFCAQCFRQSGSLAGVKSG